MAVHASSPSGQAGGDTVRGSARASMLTLYLTCLVVGGVFVTLSAVGAVGKDLEVGGDVEAEVDLDVDADVDADADVDHGGTAVGHLGDAGQALAVADGTHGLVPHRRARRAWVPVFSLRFWTFGSAFFGLTGTLLASLTGMAAPVVAALSTATGVGVGTLSAWIVRRLRTPVGASIRLADYVGTVGELVLPLREGGITRIKLHVRERERTMLAVAAEPTALPAGTRVMVLGIDESGRARIEPERNLYALEE